MLLVRKRRIQTIGIVLGLVGIAVALTLYALRQNINLYYTPSQIQSGQAPMHHSIRAGGMVVKGSIIRDSKDLSVRFQMTDYANTVEVIYRGILPDLFREGQGIVAQGQLLNPHQLQAVQVLAKHDEKYMPPEVRDTLKKL